MKRFLFSLSLAAFSGCSFVPEYTRPDLPVATTYPEQLVATSNQTHEAITDWRTVYADPELQQLIELALENNRQFRIAGLKSEQIQAYYRIQKSALLPSLDGAGSGSRSRTPAEYSATGQSYTGNSFSVGLQMTSYELDFFGRIRSLSDKALQQYLSSREAERSAEITLIAAVANQYYRLIALRERRSIALNAKESAQRGYQINKDSFDVGFGSELDMRTAEGELAGYSAAELTLLEQVQQAQNLLVQLVGADLPEMRFDASVLKGAASEIEVPVGLPSELLVRRPDILAAEYQLKAANADIGAARAAFFPSVQLTAFDGTASTEFSNLFGADTSQWSFAPQITVPIFNAGRNQANLDAAEIQKRIEIANYEDTIQIAFKEVADALAVRASIDQRIGQQQQRVTANERRSELSMQRFQGGIDSYLPVLLAQQSLFAAQQELVQAQLLRLTSRSSLFAALGGAWSPDKVEGAN
jgi:multidrug efflux system outer membrane protein